MTTYVVLPLFRKGEVVAQTKVDPDDVTVVGRDPLYLGSDGYARFRDGNYKRALHRAILGLTQGDGRVVDHINRDRLDNRRGNLRVLSEAGQNQQNLSPSGSGANRFRGVSLHKASGLWHARHILRGRSYSIGYFKTEEDAGRAAAAWRAEHMTHSMEALEGRHL